jgi:hypothetical protein
VNDPVVTNAFTIGFTYEEGPSDGSSPVLDFDVYFDKAIGVWELLETGVPQLYYQTSVGLIPDQIYSFKLIARNSVGYSPYSEVVSIRAARVPDIPQFLANLPLITTAYQIGVNWQEGVYNGGSIVLDYELVYKDQASTDAYIVWDAANTDLTQTITSLTPSHVYLFKVRARNVVGYSAYTEPTVILAAQIPDEPTDLANRPEITLAN